MEDVIMVFKYGNLNLFRDILRLRNSIDMDLGEKHLKKVDSDIVKVLDDLMHKESNKIRYRSLDDVENFLDKLESRLQKKINKISNLKEKYPVGYLVWKKEKTESFQKAINDAEQDEDLVAIQLADLNSNFSASERRLLFLLGETTNQIKSTFKIMNSAINHPKFYRYNSKKNKIIKVFNGIFLVFLRIRDIENHWDKIEKHKLLIDMLRCDLNTLDGVTNSLNLNKSIKTSEYRVDEELLNALWGED